MLGSEIMEGNLTSRTIYLKAKTAHDTSQPHFSSLHSDDAFLGEF